MFGTLAIGIGIGIPFSGNQDISGGIPPTINNFIQQSGLNFVQQDGTSVFLTNS